MSSAPEEASVVSCFVLSLEKSCLLQLSEAAAE